MGDTPKKEARISPLGDENPWDVVVSAYLSSSQAASNKPLAFLDRAVSGTRDWFVRNMRSMMLTPESDSAITSLVRDATIAPFKLLDFLRGAEGDKKLSALMESNAERYFAGRAKPSEFGQYDIYMAGGWKPKGPILVNGKLVDKPEPVTNMLAVFVRHPDGKIEILEPSQKMESLTDIGKLISALYDAPKTEADKRWQETAGTFIKWQMAPLIPMIATGSIALTGSTLSKIPALGERAASLAAMSERVTAIQRTKEIASAIGKSTSIKVFGAGGVLGSAGDMHDLASGLTSEHFTQAELRAIAGGLSRLLTSPDILNKDKMRDSLNTILSDYAVKDGVNFKQTYIPSLGKQDNPFDRFRDLLHGRIAGFEKRNTPWDTWTANDSIRVAEVREYLQKDPHFQRTALAVAEKALKGRTLSDRDCFLLKVYLNQNESDQHRFPLLNPQGGFETSPAEKRELVEALRGEFSQKLAQLSRDNPKEAEKSYGIKPKAESSKSSFLAGIESFGAAQFDNSILLKYLADQIAEANKAHERGHSKHRQSYGMQFAVDLTP